MAGDCRQQARGYLDRRTHGRRWSRLRSLLSVALSVVGLSILGPGCSENECADGCPTDFRCFEQRCLPVQFVYVYPDVGEIPDAGAADAKADGPPAPVEDATPPERDQRVLECAPGEQRLCLECRRVFI